MPLKPRFTLATRLAQKLLVECRVKYPPVPLEPFLSHLKINLLPYDFPQDKVSAVFMRIDDLLVIGVNKNHHPNRQRFSIAHEIGHYHLGHHIDFSFDPSEVADGRFDLLHGNVIQEQEANHFASELLMPTGSLKSQFNKIRDAKELARLYDVSEQALWIRLMKLKII